MTKEIVFCQSCGMPMQVSADFGTESDNSPSANYCTYCYQNGKFTNDCTMNEMIEYCAAYFEEFKDENGRSYTRSEAIEEMQKFFPELKRWKK